jgi:alpha-N-acetylglucosamine transferase
MEQSNKKINKILRANFQAMGAKVCQVDRVPLRDETATKPRYRDQFTKLRIWEMIEYESCIYFDLDCLVVGNIDYMFEVHKLFDPTKHKIAVSTNYMQGKLLSTFNMGVFVIRPSKAEFDRLVLLKNDRSFKFDATYSEQGFLNQVYKAQWYELPFEYNANVGVYHLDRPLWESKASNVSVIHFTISKPWVCEEGYEKMCDLWRNFTL